MSQIVAIIPDFGRWILVIRQTPISLPYPEPKPDVKAVESNRATALHLQANRLMVATLEMTTSAKEEKESSLEVLTCQEALKSVSRNTFHFLISEISHFTKVENVHTCNYISHITFLSL